MGYENCGRREEYPYDQLLDGRPHIIRVASEHQIRALRFGAKRRGMFFWQRKIGSGLYEIVAKPGFEPGTSRL